MASLAQLLVNAQAPAKEVRNAAVEILMKQRAENSAQFLVSLSRELSSESEPKIARQLSGLLLKNTLLNSTLDPALSSLWERVPPNDKLEVKQHSLASLASSDRDVRQSAAQAVAAIAGVELPKGEWSDLLPVLLSNATGANLDFRVSSIMTLGYILESLDAEQLDKSLSNQILTALASNILAAVPSEVKLEAIKALSHALPFSSQNFKNESERGHIMKMVLICSQDPSEDIRISAFQALCEIALLYYDYIATHLTDLWNTTSAAIRGRDVKVASLAMEFWNIIADVEKERKENPHPSKSMRNIIYTAAPGLLPLLFEGILQAEEDTDEWTLYKSSGANLLLVAQIAGDPIVDHCVSFISQNLQSPNWKHRHAATLVIGSIMDGPSASKLTPVVMDGFKAVLLLLKDTNTQVRITAAWTLSRMCEFHFQSILMHPNAVSLLSAITDGLNDHPKVAAHACTVAVMVSSKGTFGSVFAPQSFDLLFAALMQTAYREATPEVMLQTAAFTAVETLISKSEAGFEVLLEGKLEAILKLLKETRNENEQNWVCSIFAACVRKVKPESLSDVFIQSVIATLSSQFQQRGGVYEEAIHLFGALTNSVRERIYPHMRVFGPFIAVAVSKRDEAGLCKAGTMVVGDLARGLERLVAEFVGELLPLLVKILESGEVTTDVKIQSIESMGDLAQAAKDAFLPYFPQVMPFIETAANSSLQPIKDDPDLFSYLLELREVIVQFYISLLQGLSEARQADLLLQYVPKVVQYAFLTTQEQYKPSVTVHLNALGLIGDIAVAYGLKAKSIVCNPVLVNYIKWQVTGTNGKIKELARWALGQVSALSSL